jgi:hypothetical protein
MTQAWLIENPAAGQDNWAAQIAAAQATLEGAGWQVELKRTAGPGDATAFAREAVAAGMEVVIVAGGDGTVNEALQGLAGQRTTALAVLPPALAALPRGPGVALIVLIALIIYHQVESHLIIPRVYGQVLRLSPLAVLVALLVGGELLGIVGALLALPLAAGLRVLVEQLRINLPGEQPGEAAQRATDAEAEAAYLAQASGTSAVEAAAIATGIAGEMQEATKEEAGTPEVPIEERGDSPLPHTAVCESAP